MELKQLIDLLENLFPSGTALEGDRIGLQIQSEQNQIKNLMVAYELTDKVAEEAVLHDADCIVVFHPLIYRPLKAIEMQDRVGRVTAKLIKNDISLISLHTRFDVFIEGTSKILADLLGLEVTDFLVPDKNEDGYGMGVICKPKGHICERELLQKVCSVCGSPARFGKGKQGSPIERIGIVGGSGSSFLNDAFKKDLDVYITADISYHTYHAADGRMMLIDPGHYEMEQFVPAAIAKIISDKTEEGNINIFSSFIVTNPVRYFPNPDNYLDLQTQNIFRNNNKLYGVE